MLVQSHTGKNQFHSTFFNRQNSAWVPPRRNRCLRPLTKIRMDTSHSGSFSNFTLVLAMRKYRYFVSPLFVAHDEKTARHTAEQIWPPTLVLNWKLICEQFLVHFVTAGLSKCFGNGLSSQHILSFLGFPFRVRKGMVLRNMETERCCSLITLIRSDLSIYVQTYRKQKLHQ